MSEHDGHRHHDHNGHAGHHDVDFESPEMVAHAELDGEALRRITEDAVARLAQRSAGDGLDVRRVVDVGSGPGIGTAVLAGRFDRATVVAVDASGAMLQRAQERADRLGFGNRVEAHQRALPADLRDLGPADVAWSSMAVHHVGDESEALRRIREVLRPGGLLALVERGAPLRVLGGDAAQWDRFDAAWASWFAGMRAGLPGAVESVGYPEMLRAAGFEVLSGEEVTHELPLDAGVRRFVEGQLGRGREALAPYLDAADIEALGAVLDALGRNEGGAIRASRHLYLARARG